ncbi:asparagine synthetase domain-containing protein 1 [Galendromus occidentalis]|uniref:Asparagine synthetase domain-containing protein 1 n=1 Tax=Galendromus occidentalis TaxID=34638 RepID=A0AAJ6QWB3_9ACAR|nr:asparagine synthetase domain-containing protein 1 [Galendromus occidentalis]
MDSTSLTFHAAVLSLRGDGSDSQPHQSEEGLLCFNGEIYEGLESTSPEQSDSRALFRALQETHSLEGIVQIIGSLRGPWALSYFCSRTGKLLFGRDVFGRRCLLVRKTCCGFQLTSVACPESSSKFWEEIPVRGIYVYDVNDSSLSLLEWDHSPTGELFHSFVPCSTLEDVQLLELKIACPIRVPLNRSLGNLELMDDDLAQQLDSLTEKFGDAVESLGVTFRRAVVTRIEKISDRHRDLPIGILFSGGIDSVLIAAFAVQTYPEKKFDLINVAFEHKDSDGVASYQSPDRQSSIAAFEELRVLGGQLRLICVDIPHGEVESAKLDGHIPSLIYPMNSVLDESIGFALWFAARGEGYDFHTKDPHRSLCKVLLVGMGADEQLGGYSRHAASFKERDWTVLLDCIARDIDRISWRNMGRDDRVIGDLSREVRTPFLDENLVAYLNSLPISLKMQLHQNHGAGKKLILRLLAHSMGLKQTALRSKRAMQFGSRFVNSYNKKRKGHESYQRSSE